MIFRNNPNWVFLREFEQIYSIPQNVFFFNIKVMENHASFQTFVQSRNGEYIKFYRYIDSGTNIIGRTTKVVKQRFIPGYFTFK